MRHPVRRPIILATLIALHGIAILCGPAMHRHDRRGGLSWGAEGANRAPLAHVGLSNLDCPICHDLAQGPLADDDARIERPGCVAGDVRRLEPREASPDLARTSRPRAPPRA